MKKILFITTFFLLSLSVQADEAVFTKINPAKPLVAFQFNRTPQGVLTNQDLKGHWTFLFFGFTYCASICPMTLSELNQAYQQIKADGKALPQIIFISLDPKRDTLNRLAEYMKAFNPAFIGAVGSEAQVQGLKQQLGVLALTVPQKKSEDYQIDHSGNLFLINPQGNLQAVFSMPHHAKNIVKGYENII